MMILLLQDEDVNQMMIPIHHDENVMIHLLHEEDINQMMILVHLDDVILHLLDENTNIIMIRVHQDDVILHLLLLLENDIQKMMIQVLQDVEINLYLLIDEKIKILEKNHHHLLHITVDPKKNPHHHHQLIVDQNKNHLLHHLNQLNPNDDV
jgi:hypothetical protein